MDIMFPLGTTSGKCCLRNFQNMNVRTYVLFLRPMFFAKFSEYGHAVLCGPCSAPCNGCYASFKKKLQHSKLPTFPVGLWVILFILIFKLMSLSGYLDEMTCF